MSKRKQAPAVDLKKEKKTKETISKTQVPSEILWEIMGFTTSMLDWLNIRKSMNRSFIEVSEKKDIIEKIHWSFKLTNQDTDFANFPQYILDYAKRVELVLYPGKSIHYLLLKRFKVLEELILVSGKADELLGELEKRELVNAGDKDNMCDLNMDHIIPTDNQIKVLTLKGFRFVAGPNNNRRTDYLNISKSFSKCHTLTVMPLLDFREFQKHNETWLLSGAFDADYSDFEIMPSNLLKHLIIDTKYCVGEFDIFPSGNEEEFHDASEIYYPLGLYSLKVVSELTKWTFVHLNNEINSVELLNCSVSSDSGVIQHLTTTNCHFSHVYDAKISQFVLKYDKDHKQNTEAFIRDMNDNRNQTKSITLEGPFLNRDVISNVKKLTHVIESELITEENIQSKFKKESKHEPMDVESFLNELE
jgi:hypothetical protein